MTWESAMQLARVLNKLGWKARVFGRRNINGVWIWNAEPIYR